MTPFTNLRSSALSFVAALAFSAVALCAALPVLPVA